eukprot:8929149-Alexandrium_andersonii.AAC.1
MAGLGIKVGSTDLASLGAVTACGRGCRRVRLDIVGRPPHANAIPGGGFPELVWKLTALIGRALQ